MGPKLMELLRAQAERFGTSIRTTERDRAVDLGTDPSASPPARTGLLADTLDYRPPGLGQGLGFPRKTSFATAAFPPAPPATGRC